MARAGRAKRKTRLRGLSAANVDATPERIAKGESEFVNPAEIDSSEQAIGRVRRFRASKLDRLHKAGRLTWIQWYAGDCYRNAHHRARFGLALVASYGERTTGGENSYGLPRTEAQLRARRFVMDARAQWPQSMQGFMDRLLIHDDLPRYGGRNAIRKMTEIRNALDVLAGWMRLT